MAGCGPLPIPPRNQSSSFEHAASSSGRDWTERRTKDGTKVPVTFLDFAKTEGRFRKHFDKDGNPTTDLILKGQKERLRNWWRLQELAGIENVDRKAEKEQKS